jgi:apolipoprotein N-acyltransferase
MSRVKKVLSHAGPAMASAMLCALTFPPFGLILIGFVALAPWLWYLRSVDAKRARRSGYFFGLLYMLNQVWFMFHLTSKWTGKPALALVPWIAASLIGALYWMLFGAVANKAWRDNRPWMIPVAWAGIEAVRSYMPVLAFPYGILGNSLAQLTPVASLAHALSVYGLSAMMVLFSTWCSGLLAGDAWSKWRNYAFGGGLCVTLAFALYQRPIATENHRFTIGQPGIDMAFDKANKPWKVAQVVPKLYAAARLYGAELLLLPEGLVYGGTTLPPTTDFEIEKDIPVLFGGQRGGGPMYQSAFSYDGSWQFADKTRLVIFGEFVPFRNLPILANFKLPSGDLQPASEVKALDIAGRRYGPVICFEALFPDVSWKQAGNGAKVLTVMSIDDWFMGTGEPAQLRDGGIIRAIETGLPLIRAAGLGYTMACDARGNVLAQLPLGVERALNVDLPIPTGTINPWWLPIFPWACVVLTALGLIPIRPRAVS